jgi:HNH endonuclease/AP2 domain
MENDYIKIIAFEQLIYNRDSGIFTWAISRRGVSAGTVAGTKEKTGYRKIMLNQRYYSSHRLAWLFIYGEWPNGIIDHIDGDPSNNVATNLRISNTSLNAANKKTPVTNTSGFKGVSLVKSTGKWYAAIKVNGKSINLGHYDDPKLAHDVYMNAARSHFGEHARAK